MKENSNQSPALAEMLYFPSSLVTVPVVVPFTMILTPGSGSMAFVTTPVTFTFWAFSCMNPNSVKKKNNPITCLMILKFIISK